MGWKEVVWTEWIEQGLVKCNVSNFGSSAIVSVLHKWHQINALLRNLEVRIGPGAIILENCCREEWFLQLVYVKITD